MHFSRNIARFFYVILCIFCIGLPSYSSAQTLGRLWGLTTSGGDSGGGVIFNYDKLIAYDSIVRALPSTPQAPVYTNLIQATDGNFYGMTEGGGNYGSGTVFVLNATTGRLTVLHSFTGAADGSIPYGSLIQAIDGNLYGMTYSGGSSYMGTIFKCTTSGAFTTLLNFTGTNGSFPYGSLVQAKDSNLYGMTSSGGSSSLGTIFKYTLSGTLTTIVNFAGANGSIPSGSLIQGIDGNLYGMTQTGGTADSGTIFQCTTSGTLTTLVNLNKSTGTLPYGTLMQAANGTLFGMTEAGGTSDSGTIFKCTTSGIFTVLDNLNYATGDNPFGNLMQASNGLLYGLANAGGSTNSNGTLFSCDTNGVLNVLVNFNGANNGSNPQGGLIQATDGNLYGFTNQGGSSGFGTIFKSTTSGTLTTLIVFGVTDIGSNPSGSLIQAKDGNLYGMTYGGGSNGYDGTIFMVNSYTGQVSTLYNFNDTTGANPYGSLIQGADSNFYGMTEAGGSTSLSNTEGGSAGAGTIFQFNAKTGVLATLVNFTGIANGAEPFGSLLQGYDGYLYGMTQFGGASHDGVIFKCSTTGVYSILATFSGANGKYPFNSLVQGSDSNFYGMTQYGGSSNKGIIFKCTPTGTLTTLVNFNGTNGSNPMGNLIQASDGNLYGTTVNGGSASYGTLFQCTTTGTFTTLVNFNTTNGAAPSGSLIQGSDGNLYGMTLQGGTYNRGTTFECTTAGVLTILINFTDQANGAGPQYGNLLEAMSTSIAVSTNCSGVTTLYDSVRGEKLPCTYLWSTGSTNASITGITGPGTYYVSVTDARGTRVTDTISIPAFVPVTASITGKTNITAGTKDTLTASGGVTYQWNNGSTTDTIIVTPLSTTTYTVIATGPTSCTDTATFTVTVTPTSLSELKVESGKLKIYPNPSNGVYAVELKDKSEKLKVEVYTILGEQVFSSNCEGEMKAFPSGGYGWALDLSDQPSGLYFIKVTTDKGTWVGKVIKE